MTTLELRQRFYDNLAEDSSLVTTESTTEVDRLLAASLIKLSRDHRTYMKRKVHPVAANINEFDRSDILPPLETGEAVSDLYSVSYQQGESGSISAFADAGGGAVTVTSTSHGLEADDVIQIFDTTSYNAKYTVVSAPSDDEFKITATFVADDATGTWVKESQYRRRMMTRMSYVDMEAQFYNQIQPSSGNTIPQGTLFLQWQVIPAGLPGNTSTDIPDAEFPTAWQTLIADYASIRMLRSTEDTRQQFFIQQFQEDFIGFKAWSQRQNPPLTYFMGNSYGRNGLYAFRNYEDSALLILPAWYVL